MKFDNAYSLILHLFDNGLLKGIFLGLRGEYTIEPTIKDSDLSKLLTEIFGDWRWGSSEDLDEGYYQLVKDENGDLAFSVGISSDILDFWGNPFDIEEILGILVEELGLTKIDIDEYLEYQIVLDLELDYHDTNKSKFDLQKFEIYSDNIGDEIDLEIKNKLKQIDLIRLKQVIVDYLVKIHKVNHEFNFTGFSLTITSGNAIGPYYGTGYEYIDRLKESYQDYYIEYEME